MLLPLFTHYTTSIWMNCIQFLVSYLSEYNYYNTYAAMKKKAKWQLNIVWQIPV